MIFVSEEGLDIVTYAILNSKTDPWDHLVLGKKKSEQTVVHTDCVLAFFMCSMLSEYRKYLLYCKPGLLKLLGIHFAGLLSNRFTVERAYFKLGKN